MRSSLSFRAEDFDIVSDYAEKGTTAAWVQPSLATAFATDLMWQRHPCTADVKP